MLHKLMSFITMVVACATLVFCIVAWRNLDKWQEEARLTRTEGTPDEYEFLNEGFGNYLDDPPVRRDTSKMEDHFGRLGALAYNVTVDIGPILREDVAGAVIPYLDFKEDNTLPVPMQFKGVSATFRKCTAQNGETILLVSFRDPKRLSVYFFTFCLDQKTIRVRWSSQHGGVLDVPEDLERLLDKIRDTFEKAPRYRELSSLYWLS